MKKIISIILVLMTCLVLFCACDTTEDTEEKPFKERFEIVSFAASSGMVVVDTETRVMYLFVKSGYGGGLTVMVDAEGNPLLYEGELENAE